MKKTKTTAQASLLPRRQGISYAVVALIFAVGSGAIAFAILGDLQGNLGSMTGSERLEILDVNAYVQGDRLVITGNVKNLGSSGMTSLAIDEISAGGLVITQDASINDGEFVAGHGTLTLSGLDYNGGALGPITGDFMPTSGNTATNEVKWTANATLSAFEFDSATTGGATIAVTGLSMGDGSVTTVEPLAAGSSKSFRIVVTGLSSGVNPNVLDVRETVPASTDLYVSLTGTNGITTTISDPRSDRVAHR